MIGQFFSPEEFRKQSAIEQEAWRKTQPQTVVDASAERKAHFAEPAISDEAKAIAYRSGIKELVYLAQRVIDLERKVAELENQPPHLRGVERR